MNLTQFMARQNKVVLATTGIGLLVIAILIQIVSPAGFEAHIFYLVPISFFAWFLSGRTGLVVSILSTAAALAMHRTIVPYARDHIAYWNALAWLALYIFFVQIISEVRNLYTRERAWSHTDSLTGIPNRRSLFEHLDVEKSRARRYGRPLTLAYIDLDHFKQINDKFGHNTGDQLLKIVGRIMSDGIRRADIAARLGGDEFAVLFPETTEVSAASALAKLRSSLNAAMKQHNWPVTFSIGAVTFQPPPESVQEIIGAADKAMYAVKKNGGGRSLSIDQVA